MLPRSTRNFVNVVNSITLVGNNISILNSLIDVFKSLSSCFNWKFFKLSMQVYKLINLFIIIHKIENLLIDKFVLLYSCVVHLVDILMFVVTLLFILLEFFKLGLLVSWVYVVPRVSAFGVHLLGFCKLYFIVIFESITCDDFVCPERRVMGFSCVRSVCLVVSGKFKTKFINFRRFS